MLHFRNSLFICAVAFVTSACAPNSAIRRTAFVPAATLPARTGGALEPGEMRLMGHANGLRVAPINEGIDDSRTVIDSPGVLIPDVHLGASIYGAVGGGVELGAQLSFANQSWAHVNTDGVLPFPDDDAPAQWSAGAGLRYNFTFDEPRLQLSLLGEVNMVWLPQATFSCKSESLCDGQDRISTTAALEIYEVDSVETHDFLLPQVAMQMGWEFSDYLVAFGQVGTQRQVTNVGFDTRPNTNSDTLSTHWSLNLAAGVETRVDAFVASATFYYPVIFVDNIEMGPSFQLSMGARFN